MTGFHPFEDDSDDGPQNMFHFARITFQPGSGGSISRRDRCRRQNWSGKLFPFSIVVPEPSAVMLLSVGVLVCATYQERTR